MPSDTNLRQLHWVKETSWGETPNQTAVLKAIPFLTKSCGYLIKEDKDKVILGFMLFGVNINDEPLLKHFQVIPRGMIKKITKLKNEI